jgi:PadR family transcriptional regulator, regulatory protein PadR
MNLHRSNQAEDATQTMLSEWKRGMLTFWTLSLLLGRPMYGLEIKHEIEDSTQGKMKLGASTIYQLLRRLEKRGLVESSWESTTHGPPRAYYQPTSAGRQAVHQFIDEVLSPGSPIAAAMEQLTTSLFEEPV